MPSLTWEVYALLIQILLERGDRDGTGVEHTGGQRAVHVRIDEGVAEMFRFAGTAGGDERHVADGAGDRQLFQIVAAAHAVAVHAVEHDFAGTALLRLDDPVHGSARQRPGFQGIASVLAHAPVAISVAQRVDADDHALHAERGRQLIDQSGTFQRGRVHRDLVRAGVQHGARLLDRANATGDAERDVDHAGDFLDPVAIHAAPFGTGGDVVEHQLIGAFVTIAQRQIDDLAHHHMVAEAYALDHLAVTHVETGNDATAQHASASSTLKRPSSNARPRITPCAPASRAARMSASERTPPEACTARVGALSARWR